MRRGRATSASTRRVCLAGEPRPAPLRDLIGRAGIRRQPPHPRPFRRGDRARLVADERIARRSVPVRLNVHLGARGNAGELHQIVRRYDPVRPRGRRVRQLVRRPASGAASPCLRKHARARCLPHPQRRPTPQCRLRPALSLRLGRGGRVRLPGPRLPHLIGRARGQPARPLVDLSVRTRHQMRRHVRPRMRQGDPIVARLIGCEVETVGRRHPDPVAVVARMVLDELHPFRADTSRRRRQPLRLAKQVEVDARPAALRLANVLDHHDQLPVRSRRGKGNCPNSRPSVQRSDRHLRIRHQRSARPQGLLELLELGKPRVRPTRQVGIVRHPARHGACRLRADHLANDTIPRVVDGVNLVHVPLPLALVLDGDAGERQRPSDGFIDRQEFQIAPIQVGLRIGRDLHRRVIPLLNRRRQLVQRHRPIADLLLRDRSIRNGATATSATPGRLAPLTPRTEPKLERRLRIAP